MTISIAAPDPEPSGPHRIADLVGRYTARCPGEDRLRGACPFCGSTTFQVRPCYGTFQCFGCGHGGDARAFAVKIRHHR